MTEEQRKPSLASQTVNQRKLYQALAEENRKRNARTMTKVALIVTALMAWSLYRVHEGSGWLAIVSALSLTLTFSLCWVRVAQLRRWL